MDPFTMTAVLAAVDTAASGALSGAAGELGRRTAEGLAGLARRAWRRGGGGEPPAAPTDDGGRRALAALLIEQARTEPGFARDLASWLRESEWLAAATAVPAPADGAARPRMLPPLTSAFTDRDDVLAAVTGLLDEGDGGSEGGASSRMAAPMALLVGSAGVGKTAAAVHCARALAARFPDGELYADLRGSAAATAVTPSEVLVRFLHHLGVPADRVPADEQGQADLYRERTAGRRMVVLLDNAHSASQLGPLLTASPGSLVLVTSRHRLPELVRDHGARIVRVGPLSDADSFLLLTRIAGPERVAAQRTHAEAVAARCGGIPLALCETGARVQVREQLSWESLEREFAAAVAGLRGSGQGQAPGMPDDADGLDDAAIPAIPVTYGVDDSPVEPALLATDLSYRDLAPDAARLYRLLALCPWPDIPVGAAAAVADTGEAEARRLLETLAAAHLLEETGEERYRFHDLVRLHAERRAHEEDGRGATALAVRRTVTWYLRLAARADALVVPGRWHLGPAYARTQGGDGPAGRTAEAARAALTVLRRERANLAEAVRAAEEYGFDEEAWQLCEAMWGLHLRLGFHDQWVATHLRGVEAARRCAAGIGDPRAEGRMRTQLAFGYMGLGRYAEAEAQLTSAAAADERAGHHRGRATATESLGLLCLRQWRYEAAEEHFRQARHALDGIAPGGDGAADVPRADALLAHHLGRALRGQGRHAEALAQLTDALARFRTLPDRDLYNEARVRMSLGETHLAAGDPAAARTPLDEALAVMAAEGAVLQQADAAELRARCAADEDDAVRHLRLAHSLYEEVGETAGVSRTGALLRERRAG
ncbi:ATP-binding protein [Streptomyces roseoverticillatus]|uniref:ATP-binding protein n=1 Tax=Streptomyces roseoverticillatus TaxID=66429 RepID=UPI001F19874D|nr:tetratricopeptide repeat protein [Streptomyces roseoverticillatus]